MSRLHRQKLRQLARAGETPAHRPDPVAVATQAPTAPMKPSRAKRPRRKAVGKSKSKAKRR